MTESEALEELAGPKLQDLKNRFSFHPVVTDDRKEDHELVRELAFEIATRVLILVPPGREQNTALTKIEEMMFWANAGIARAGAFE